MLSSNCKVLLMTAPIGSGHIRAAEAVATAVRNSRADAATRLVNVFDFLPQRLGTSILHTYLQILKIVPQAYGMMYGWGNSSAVALTGREIISKFLAKRMLKYINDYQPTVIVCTHATPAGIVASLIKAGKITVPAIAVVTDFVVHRLWVYPEMTHYFVANDEMREYLAQHNVPLAHSTVSGIPVAQQFSQPQDKKQLAAKLGLDLNVPIILIMGGGAGVLPMDEILAAGVTLPGKYQFLAVTGHNHKMYMRLQRYRGASRHSLHVFEYINNTHELMAVADVLISKPGGLTSAEALASGLPVIIYHPIPGQEEANTSYLVERNVATCANSVQEVAKVLGSLFETNSQQLAMMKDLARVQGRPRAAAEIAAYILQ